MGHIYNGRERPSEAFKVKVAAYLGVPAAKLFDEHTGSPVDKAVDRILDERVGRLPRRVEDAATIERVAAIVSDAEGGDQRAATG